DRFDGVETDTKIYRFFIMRDLRDTLVSAYFSMKYSHRMTADNNIRSIRGILSDLELEDGLLYLINEHTLMTGSARIQQSWLNTDTPVIRFEDMIQNDV